jgi:uncharacterized protein
MVGEVINAKRREFLGTSASILSTVVIGGSTMTVPITASAQSAAVKQPAVIGYPNKKGLSQVAVEAIAIRRI